MMGQWSVLAVSKAIVIRHQKPVRPSQTASPMLVIERQTTYTMQKASMNGIRQIWQQTLAKRSRWMVTCMMPVT